MTTFTPRGLSEHSTIGPHQGLRVTFAQTRSGFTPDVVEWTDFRQNIAHLVEEMESGGFALAIASDPVPPAGALAWTIDFIVPTSGHVSVGTALNQLRDGLYGPFDFAQRTYLRDVALIGNGGVSAGSPIPKDTEDTERSPLGTLAVWGTVALGVAALVYFAPEIRMAIRTAQRRAA